MSSARDVLGPTARTRLAELIDEVTTNPTRLAVLFPAAARTIARGPVDPADPDGLITPRIEDEVRIGLLRAAERRFDRSELAVEITALYRHGDAEEKRAVLRALDNLDLGDALLPLVHDALRSNDSRLIAAALGTYAARYLDDHAWRHGVLKCVFTGVPLDAVVGVAERADAELSRMVHAYIAERLAAGRPVPQDAHRLLQLDSEDAPAGDQAEEE
ncbi:EboA domain-containing protein [Saccharopolyspora endophytica]|uniref:EboA domain-containing protein n=1 Tax=Saccharopolyspora endophytica TaxID=543886 RepID=A0ABS5DL97_9PSEU|nr:EboA domain-containing protein [Saccharopolyspora endophytica]MBQ0927070.1 EboA domain-containing protein [Saccharopolyspora endophytica]